MRSNASVPTLEDVARIAKVHPSTVSRYFSNPAIVSADTSAKIESAVAEIGYIQNMVAGSLASSKRRLVALLVANLAYSNFNEAIEEITSGLTGAGTNVMLCITGGSGDRSDQMIAAALRWRVDALIAWAPITPSGADLLRSSGATVLQISANSTDPIDIGIGFDEAAAGQALARFAFDRGYARPHLVTTRGSNSALRRDGFVTEWHLLGGAHVSEQTIEPPANYQQGRKVFAEIRRMERLPDMVVCASDYLAQAIIIEANAHGYRVPADVGVVGLGNTPMSAEMRPTLTTIDLHTSGIPAEALRLLDARGRGERLGSQHIDLGFTLIARESA